MAETTAKTAAERIWDHWQRGEVMDDLPAQIKPQSRKAGYDIQEHLGSSPEQQLAGWKIAATSSAGQNHIGVDGPLAGRIFQTCVAEPGTTISIKTNRMRVCEPEFAFRFAKDVPLRDTPFSVDEVMALVGDLHLTLELPDSRFADFASVGGATLIADCACARDLVVGPAVTADWRSIDLSQHPVIGHVTGHAQREGTGANVLGDPRVALTWLVNELSMIGTPLRAGQFVTTGTTMVPLEIVEGDEVMADFGMLGRIQVQIAA